MTTRKPHQWYLVVTEDARDQIRKLPVKDRLAVFGAIRELLTEENPGFAAGTRKLVEKQFEGLWRKRQGGYRIFFALIPGRTVVDKFRYRGKLQIVAVVHRKDAY